MTHPRNNDFCDVSSPARSPIDVLIGGPKVDDLVLVTRNVRDMEGMGVKLLNPWTN